METGAVVAGAKGPLCLNSCNDHARRRTMTNSAETNEAIRQVIYDYCRALDRLDQDLLTRVFHPDAVIDLGALYQGAPQAFFPFAMGFMKAMTFTRHEIFNVRVEQNGDHAAVETYVRAWHRLEREGQDYELAVHARYIDEFSCRGGVWAISHRSEVIDWAEERPVSSAWFESNAEMLKGARDSSDLSYESLRKLNKTS